MGDHRSSAGLVSSIGVGPIITQGLPQHSTVQIGAFNLAQLEAGPSRPKALDDLTRNPCKLFVGGLGQHTTNETIRDHFEKFGPLLEAAVMLDKRTGRSRGFAFVVFEDPQSARRCLSERHKIDGVACDLRIAVPRDEARDTPAYDTIALAGKIFVGGLPEELDEQEFRDIFSKFGTVRDATLMYDKLNHRPRGFGFVVFESHQDAERAVGLHQIRGNECEAKRAQPRDATDWRYRRNPNGPIAPMPPYSGGAAPRGPPRGGQNSYDYYGQGQAPFHPHGRGGGAGYYHPLYQQSQSTDAEWYGPPHGEDPRKYYYSPQQQLYRARGRGRGY